MYQMNRVPLRGDQHTLPTYARGLRPIRLTITTCVDSGTLFYSEGVNCNSVRTRAKTVPAYIVKFRRASRNRKELPEFKDSFKELSTKVSSIGQETMALRQSAGSNESYEGSAGACVNRIPQSMVVPLR
jgi:hypothetical protein